MHQKTITEVNWRDLQQMNRNLETIDFSFFIIQEYKLSEIYCKIRLATL